MHIHLSLLSIYTEMSFHSDACMLSHRWRGQTDGECSRPGAWDILLDYLQTQVFHVVNPGI